MLKHFTGTYEHKMDDKGRVSLPTEFRRVLDAVGSSGSLYIVPCLENRDSHVVFDTDAYAAAIARHNAHEYPDRKSEKRAELKLIKRATQIQIDDMGRIVLKKDLRDMIELEKAVTFAGVGDRFEIWNPSAHGDLEDDLLDGDDADDMPLNLRGLR